MASYTDIEQKIFLLKAALSGELSAKEQEELEEWLNASEGNRKIYEQICNRQRIAEKLGFYQQGDMEADWKEVHRQISGGSRRRVYLRWISYAAVFAGIILIAFIYTSRQTTEIPGSLVLNTDSIRPGSRQAYIELVNGERIVLGGTDKGLVKQVEGGILKEGEEGLVLEGNDSVPDCPEKVEYNRVIVPRGGEYQLVLADGTRVWMNSDSKLEFPILFRGSERRVRLQGEAYFQVKRNRQMPFRVEANGTEVAVLGTEFNIQAYGENVRTTLVEGAVAVKVEGNTFRLVPGEEADVNGGKVVIAKVDVYERIAWKEGKFVFREKRLEEVMDILGRWYDVEIVYRNAAARELHFTGNIPRHATIGEVLEFLERTRLVHFSIMGRTVMVSD